MLTIEKMRELLKQALPRKRFDHSVLVYETALKLGKAHGCDLQQVAVAALLHDCGREVPIRDSLDKVRALGLPLDFVEENQPILLHAKLGAWYAEHKYGVTNPAILRAIRLHTTGAPDMTDLDMVVFLADLLEPTRDFPHIDELRKLAKEDLRAAMFQAFKNTMNYLVTYDLLVHPNCVAAYNQIAAFYKRQAHPERKGK